MDWQPIETAPKDGTEIVVIGPIWQRDHNSEYKVGQVIYSCISFYSPDDRKYPYCTGWHFGSPGLSTIIEPTHWMPLPLEGRGVTAREKYSELKTA